MDRDRFDRLARALAARTPRRGAVGLLSALGLGLGLATTSLAPDDAAAKGGRGKGKGKGKGGKGKGGKGKGGKGNPPSPPPSPPPPPPGTCSASSNNGDPCGDADRTCICATVVASGGKTCVGIEEGCSLPCDAQNPCTEGRLCVDDGFCAFPHCHTPCDLIPCSSCAAGDGGGSCCGDFTLCCPAKGGAGEADCYDAETDVCCSATDGGGGCNGDLFRCCPGIDKGLGAACCEDGEACCQRDLDCTGDLVCDFNGCCVFDTSAPDAAGEGRRSRGRGLGERAAAKRAAGGGGHGAAS